MKHILCMAGPGPGPGRAGPALAHAKDMFHIWYFHIYIYNATYVICHHLLEEAREVGREAMEFNKDDMLNIRGEGGSGGRVSGMHHN